ncbi:hypothetical protein [Desulfatibacillum aliphaticivorans]|uniref:hypothetical protein n=1 Tax=Desulfatibacillum aliphaticivorans TaxID=218208 RepID=UPI00143C9395|nr:hypothetical protein [Desulfatibacillum aliphaticivorans]
MRKSKGRLRPKAYRVAQAEQYPAWVNKSMSGIGFNAQQVKPEFIFAQKIGLENGGDA